MRNTRILDSKPQILSISGEKYIRAIVNEIDIAEISELKEEYSYIHIYTYQRKEIEGFTIREQPTPIIDLSQDGDEIFKKFEKYTRRGIRRAEKNEDLRFVSIDKDTELSYDFYKEIKQKAGVKPAIEQDFTGSLVFNAYYKGEIALSNSYYDTGKILRAEHTVSLIQDDKKMNKAIGEASRKSIWDLCCYAKAENYDKIDMGGVNYDNPSKKGLLDFKTSFGGEVVMSYTYRFETKKFKTIREKLEQSGKSVN